MLFRSLSVALLWSGAIAASALIFFRGQGKEMPSPANPAALKSALLFGLIYAGVTLAVAAVRQQFGATGLYGVAMVSGLTDMDAITLSLARMVEGQSLDPASGWRLMLAASLANFVFKGIAATFLGGWAFGWRLWPFFIVVLAGGVALIRLWPVSGPF